MRSPRFCSNFIILERVNKSPIRDNKSHIEMVPLNLYPVPFRILKFENFSGEKYFFHSKKRNF